MVNIIVSCPERDLLMLFQAPKVDKTINAADADIALMLHIKNDETPTRLDYYRRWCKFWKVEEDPHTEETVPVSYKSDEMWVREFMYSRFKATPQSTLYIHC